MPFTTANVAISSLGMDATSMPTPTSDTTEPSDARHSNGEPSADQRRMFEAEHVDETDHRRDQPPQVVASHIYPRRAGAQHVARRRPAADSRHSQHRRSGVSDPATSYYHRNQPPRFRSALWSQLRLTAVGRRSCKGVAFPGETQHRGDQRTTADQYGAAGRRCGRPRFSRGAMFRGSIGWHGRRGRGLRPGRPVGRARPGR